MSQALLEALQNDHRQLDDLLERFEGALHDPRPLHPKVVSLALDRLRASLQQHIPEEERHFYLPLAVSHRLSHDLMNTLEAEHQDLLKTLEELSRLQEQGRATSDDEAFLAYGLHLADVYRAHTEREHRLVFPLLEQPAPADAAAPVGRIEKDMTLNAVIARFPHARQVLHRFQLNRRWFGVNTVEEVAWYHGLSVDELVGELNRSVGHGSP